MQPFHPMALLLKFEGYPPAVLIAALLHGFLLYIILDNPLIRNDLVNLEEPIYVNATTTEQNPQRLRRIQELELQRNREIEAQRQREREAAAQRTREEQARQQQTQQEAARAEQARQERELAQRRQQETEQQAQRQAADQRRQEQERLDRQSQQQLAREQELARQAELQQQQAVAAAQQSAADARAVDTYVAIIYNAVSSNWVIPPSARNGMTAVLAIRLVPTGELISVDIIRSSGDAAFDRSVEQAVRRAGRFPELREMSTTLFESSFRNLTLTFRPEDLLR